MHKCYADGKKRYGLKVISVINVVLSHSLIFLSLESHFPTALTKKTFL